MGKGVKIYVQLGGEENAVGLCSGRDRGLIRDTTS